MSERSLPSETPEGAEEESSEIIAGRFRIERPIARGGMAEVFLAEQIGLRRKVALKILAPPGGAEDTENFKERFRLEAETLASLSHPNIVVLHDYGRTEDGRFFLAMEYIDGPRFTDLLREGPFTPERAIDLILQICAALRYAHKRGVIHRDLKPSNLLVKTEDGHEQVRVVDFGLARLTDEQSITRSGMILGSPHCMSPEAVSGADIDARADIYSLGILLFRSVTGKYPFHGATSAATMIAHVNQPTPTFFSANPDLQVPSGLEDVVRRCLEKRPEARYQNVEELAGALAACRAVAPELFESVNITHTVITQKLKRAESRERWRRIVPGVLIGLVTALVGVGIWRLGVDSGPATATTATAASTPPPVVPEEGAEVVRIGPTPTGESPDEVPPGDDAEPSDAGEGEEEGSAADEEDLLEASGPAVEEPPVQAVQPVQPVQPANAGSDAGAAAALVDTPAPDVGDTPDETGPDETEEGGDKDEVVEELMPSPY